MVTRVLSRGSKICVKYYDGDTDVLNYPDENIILNDEAHAEPKKQRSASGLPQRNRNNESGSSSRRRSRPDFFYASPWNDDGTGVEAGTSLRSRNSGSGSTSQRKSSPSDGASSGKDARTMETRNSELGSTLRRRSRPNYFFASPWNDGTSETDGDKDCLSEQLSVVEQRNKMAVGQKVKVRYYFGVAVSCSNRPLERSNLHFLGVVYN